MASFEVRVHIDGDVRQRDSSGNQRMARHARNKPAKHAREDSIIGGEPRESRKKSARRVPVPRKSHAPSSVHSHGPSETHARPRSLPKNLDELQRLRRLVDDLIAKYRTVEQFYGDQLHRLAMEHSKKTLLSDPWDFVLPSEVEPLKFIP